MVGAPVWLAERVPRLLFSVCTAGTCVAAAVGIVTATFGAAVSICAAGITEAAAQQAAG